MPDLARADYAKRLEIMVPEDSTGGLFDPLVLLDMAIEQLNMDVPREVATDVTGDGGEDYDLSASAVCGGTTGWVDDYSTIRSIEYETQDDRADAPSYQIDDEDWQIQRDPTNGPTLVFLGATPTASETFRVTFTRKWSLTATENTLPDHYAKPVCHLAASMYFRRLAADANSSRDMSLNAGLVNFGGRNTGHHEQATWHEAQYKDFFGLSEGGRAASATRRHESRTGDGNHWVFHRQP